MPYYENHWSNAYNNYTVTLYPFVYLMLDIIAVWVTSNDTYSSKPMWENRAASSQNFSRYMQQLNRALKVPDMCVNNHIYIHRGGIKNWTDGYLHRLSFEPLKACALRLHISFHFVIANNVKLQSTLFFNFRFSLG